MKTLDRQKDFGTITGDTDGRCYVQGDTYFDFMDREIKPAPAEAKAPETKTVTKPDAKAVAAQAGPDAKVDGQLAQQ